MLFRSLDSAIAAQELAYKACIAAGRADCGVELNPTVALTPELLAALATLVVVGLVPIIVKRIRARSRVIRPSG